MSENKLIILCIGAAANAFLTYDLYHHSVMNTEYQQYFRSPHMFNYESYPVAVLSVCIFLLLFDIPAPRAGKLLPEKAVNVFTKLLSFLSQTTLLTYLFSYIFDLKFYNPFNVKYEYPNFPLRFRHFFEIQPKSYFCSLLCAIPVLLLYNLAEKLIRRLAAKRETSKT